MAELDSGGIVSIVTTYTRALYKRIPPESGLCNCSCYNISLIRRVWRTIRASGRICGVWASGQRRRRRCWRSRIRPRLRICPLCRNAWRSSRYELIHLQLPDQYAVVFEETVINSLSFCVDPDAEPKSSVSWFGAVKPSGIQTSSKWSGDQNPSEPEQELDVHLGAQHGEIQVQTTQTEKFNLLGY